MTPKPKGRPNLLHQQIVGELLRNRDVTRVETRGRRTRQGWEEYEVKVSAPTLAGYVSEESIARMIERWTP